MGKKLTVVIIGLILFYQIIIIIFVSFTLNKVYASINPHKVNEIIDELIVVYKEKYELVKKNSPSECSAVEERYTEILSDKQHYFLLNHYLNRIKNNTLIFFGLITIAVLFLICASLVLYINLNTGMIDAVFHSLNIYKKTGALNPINTDRVVLYKEQGLRYNTIIRDANRLKQQKDAESAFSNKTGSGLFFMHEIKNMLSPLMLRIESIKHYGTMPDNISEDICAIERALLKGTQKMKSYRSLFNLNKPEYVDVDIKNMIESIIEFIDLNRIVIVEGDNSIVYSDKFYLETIFKNIIKNSIEAVNSFSFAKPLFVRVIINENIVIVENNGPEISKDIIDKVFEAGFSTKESGDGIGLYLVKELCEISGYEITLESNNSLTKYTVKLIKENS